MLKNRCKETETGEIQVKDTSYDALLAYLQYIYGNEVTASGDELMDLHELSHKYFDNELKLKCEELMEKQISTNSCIPFYLAALQYERSDLENVCLRFMANRMTSAIVKLEAFQALDATVAKELLIKFARLNLKIR